MRAAVEDACGAAVVSALTQPRGFTPGLACRVLLADGGRLFVKAAGDPSAPWVADAYRSEAAVVSALPDAVPAPRVRWTLEVDGWTVVAFEDVEGRHPARPWTSADAALVLDTLAATAEALTPPPPGVLADDARTALGELAAMLAPLDVPHAAELRALAAAVVDLEGTTLVHDDVRDDNLLLTADGRVLVVDWNHAFVGPAWYDTVCTLVPMHADGLDADALLSGRPLTSDVDPDHVDGLLALLLGYMVTVAAQDEVPTSPSLRTHQAWFRDATWSWLSARRGWDEPLGREAVAS